MTDTNILNILNTNPQKGIEMVMKEYMGLVYTIVFNKLNYICSKEDIEECVSDVFFNLYSQKENIDLTKGSIKAIICTIAKRRAIDIYRSKISTLNLISIDNEAFPYDLSDDFCIETAFTQKEERIELIKAINSLKEPDREILIRKYYLCENSKKIADYFSMSVNAVDLRIFRTLKKLKDMLEVLK